MNPETVRTQSFIFKCQAKRDLLFKIVSQAYNLIEKKRISTGNDIFSRVLLLGTKGYLEVRATDKDNSFQGKVPAKISTPGKVVVDAQSLFDILKELKSGDVSLEQKSENQLIRLEQGSSVFNLFGVDVSQFPTFPDFKMDDSFKMKTEDIKSMIDQTLYASSIDETRYHLTGVYFEVVKQSTALNRKEKPSGKGLCFRFVATDGHRLALSEVSAGRKFFSDGVIISRKGVGEIKRLLSSSEEETVEVAIEKPRILFRFPHAVLSVKLVEGEYPGYQAFIPKSHSLSFRVNREQFIQSLRRVALLLSSTNRFYGVTFQIQEKNILMKTADIPKIGSARDKVGIMDKKGDNITMQFNARYVLDTISSFYSEDLVVEIMAKDKACLFYPYATKGEKQQNLGVVMPMRL